MLIDIVHTTRFIYNEAIEESVVEAWLEPRTDADQRRLRFALDIQPRTPVFTYVDGFENVVHCLSVLPPHRSLTVTARSRVDTYLANPFAPPEREPQPLDAVDAWHCLQYGGPVLLVQGVQSLADRFQPAAPENTMEALSGLMRHIRETFTYEKEVTTVTSTVEDLLELGRGVCQDFAHLMIAVCRAMNVPARYVSGYILGDPSRPSRGSAASHAWCEAFVPGYGWRGFDPTNNLLAADGHVKVGIGRGYPDVPPTRGTYRGAAEKRIEVEVATRTVEAPGL